MSSLQARRLAALAAGAAVIAAAAWLPTAAVFPAAIAAALGWCAWLERGARLDAKAGGTHDGERVRKVPAVVMLAGAVGTIGVLTAVFAGWLGVTNHTTVALSFLLVVLIVATVSTRAVAVAASVTAFLCFNYFFIPPLHTWTIADPENLIALFALLAVSLVASHLSAEVRRRAAEATELVEQRKEAELARRSAELKSTLLASLGHDLKTPLTAVTVAVNNLDAAWLSAAQRHEQAEIARMELERLNRLFQGLVDMARIDTREVAAEPEWVLPGDLVDAALQQAQDALASHPISVEDVAEKILIRLDPRLTSAALAHVLENAGLYSPAGSPIRIGVTHEDGELRITVRDAGPGIAPGDRERIFERFYRGVTTRERQGGTGMGLAIARGLLGAEGGKVWADNHPDGGALFTLAITAERRRAPVEEAV